MGVAKKSLLHQIIRRYTRFILRLFYRNIEIIGQENLVNDVPVIFAPTHQNAAMDALAVGLISSRQVLYFARADIFKSSFMSRVLSLLKIAPLYRMRDGIASLDQNEESFDLAIGALSNGLNVCLMPEGTHEGRRYLKPLQKGIFRIALKAYESLETKNIFIIPVSVHYSNYYCYRSSLSIIIGKPILVNDCMLQGLSDVPVVMNKLKETLSFALKRIMVHIEPQEDIELLEQLVMVSGQYSNGFRKNKTGGYGMQKYVADTINSLSKRNPKMLDIIKDLFKTKLDNKKKPRISFLLVILYPLFILGIIVFSPVFLVPKIVNSNIGDKQFHSSIKLIMAALLLPLWTLALVVISFFTFGVYCSIISLPLLLVLLYILMLFKDNIIRQQDKRDSSLIYSLIADPGYSKISNFI